MSQVGNLPGYTLVSVSGVAHPYTVEPDYSPDEMKPWDFDTGEYGIQY